MLQTIRDYTQGWIASVIISIIILTFALWGIHSYFLGGANDTIIAKVNSVEISREQLAAAYERLHHQVQSQYGLNSPLAKDEAVLKDRALQTLVEGEVLKQASLSQGFWISDAQVDAYLQSIPSFQVNGKFSIERFQEVLSSSLLSTGEFLKLIHASLLIDQPKLGIALTSFALPAEVSYTISLVNQERAIQYINLPVQYFLSQPITISQAQIQHYYEQHQNDFMTPEQVSVEYITLSLKDLAVKMNPSEDVLRGYYEENISSYTQQKGQKVQSFEAVKDKVKEAYVRQHAEEKLADLREQLANLTYEHPDSLAVAAKTLNLPIQTSELFTRDKAGNDISQNKKVRDIAFSNDVMNLHNNSDVIQLNPETVIVLRLKSHVASTLLPLKDVSSQITATLKTEEATARAAKLADDLKAKLQAGADPKVLAAAHQLTWNDAGYLGRYSTKVDSAILDMAFSLPNPAPIHTKITYGVTRLPNGYAIVALSGVKEGVVLDKKQAAIFAEQVQNSDGLLEYELYKQSQMRQAKIEIQQSGSQP
ncbi:MAG: hypothetical protein EPO11_00950 [Gammaproteobacteria bacterium]|nr:MAG: hypothetical protein EPO11_00950 [Gammaproteobacteria bacterium]